MTAHLIAVVGSSPGVGKSTLCDSLVRWLDEAGIAVDHFEEAHILTRPEFRGVAEEFADGAGSVRPRTLVAALRRYVEHARRDGVDVLVTDAMIPFIPSLVAWGHDEAAIAAVIEDVAEAIALRRAIDHEGPEWATGTSRSLERHPVSGRSTTWHRRWTTFVGKRT